jgi:hypothetical protein
MASIKEIEKEVKEHSTKIATFDRFLDVEFPKFEERMKKYINGGSKGLTTFQYLTIILGILTLLVTLLLKT